MDSFEYTPLENASSDIRLVSLQYDIESAIHCRLDVVNADPLADLYPKYVAISYVWGDGSDLVPLSLNGRRRMVSRNLHIALQYFKRMRFRNWLWIDALCINQEDQAEKSHQIMRMRSIYERAAGVVGWLGPESPKSTVIFSTLETLAIKSAQATTQISTSERPLPVLMRRYRNGQSVPEAVEHLGLEIDRMLRTGDLPRSETTQLFSRPFWTRIWILQEVSAARSLGFYCGIDTISAFYFIWAFMACMAFFEGLDGNSEHPYQWLEVHGCPPLTMVNGLIGAIMNNEFGASLPAESLMENLQQVKGRCQATDPRDMIFALLEICSDAKAAGITVDYTTTTEALYTAVARYLFKCIGVKLITLAESNGPNSSTLPSWVPDWRSEPLQSLSACTKTWCWPEELIARHSSPCFSEPSMLVLQGIQFDVVSEVGEAWNARFSGHPFAALCHWFEKLEELASRASTLDFKREGSVAVMAVSLGRELIEEKVEDYEEMRHFSRSSAVADDNIHRQEQVNSLLKKNVRYIYSFDGVCRWWKANVVIRKRVSWSWSQSGEKRGLDCGVRWS
ncbi:hypothetical protein EPUS_02266 [Endocarpon pusillum Z07020]|uniref:Heterokaryon incompatibility domain-containing protein n=1 Tax=Endocarpon pusillum (strain Z07020 / HMAS-L-300199) TaxID=1263415 RepID=U1GGD5_ENDPU|nr:uncharacterized protein EPUS_02266 [Endocarpon pusillum Z07020]ERF76727.1 hypothetical protein EPUS_02266 [Endocarpon pusillum Z07020]